MSGGGSETFFGGAGTSGTMSGGGKDGFFDGAGGAAMPIGGAMAAIPRFFTSSVETSLMGSGMSTRSTPERTAATSTEGFFTSATLARGALNGGR